MTFLKTTTDLSLTQTSLCARNCELGAVLEKTNCICVGDLHGNYIKLISVLLHFEFINYRNLSVSKDYSDVVNLEGNILFDFHDRSSYPYNNQNNFKLPCHLRFDDGDALVFTIKNFFLNRFVFQQNKTHIVFIGDTICDRGVSDFITLCIFELLDDHGISYSVLYGNHEHVLAQTKIFSQNPQLHSFDQEQWNFFFRSFDFFKITKNCQNTYKKMYRKYMKKMFLFNVFFRSNGKNPVLLTHAPCNIYHFKYLLKEFHDSSQTHFSSYIELLSLFDPEKSVEAQNKLNRFFMTKILDLMNGHFGVKNSLLSLLSDFTGTRNMYGSSFFEELESSHTYSFRRNYLPPIHVFGHMADTDYMVRRSLEVCIDTPTGKPGSYSGDIYYKLFNIDIDSLRQSIKTQYEFRLDRLSAE